MSIRPRIRDGKYWLACMHSGWCRCLGDLSSAKLFEEVFCRT